MKSSLIFLTAVGSAQAFLSAPALQQETALAAQAKFGFRPYDMPDVERADNRQTWFPADKPIYEPCAPTGNPTKVWVPFVKDPYGHSKQMQTEEELSEQLGALETKKPNTPPKPKTKGIKLLNGEPASQKYPRWIQSC
eukprot:CAMPEP_0176015536 /NCGR_PEP_ID=MMETSP0120_2-20121206/7388_1 /TAXON_ID=160619 /ORGANISM="Kryptoperidinium foliaceum, Strain CCMP 1326" /LENGTH=137 /DNA_ID=CAMNT_0017348509 /DNA_START=41 /DNA_END=454 /DNA_ORIENTATION=-